LSRWVSRGSGKVFLEDVEDFLAQGPVLRLRALLQALIEEIIDVTDLKGCHVASPRQGSTHRMQCQAICMHADLGSLSLTEQSANESAGWSLFVSAMSTSTLASLIARSIFSPHDRVCARHGMGSVCPMRCGLQAACRADFAGSLVAARTLRSSVMSRAMIASVKLTRANAPRPLSPIASPVNRLSIAFLQNVYSLFAGSQPAAHTLSYARGVPGPGTAGRAVSTGNSRLIAGNRLKWAEKLTSLDEKPEPPQFAAIPRATLHMGFARPGEALPH
jgi:hypothetical protein